MQENCDNRVARLQKGIKVARTKGSFPRSEDSHGDITVNYGNRCSFQAYRGRQSASSASYAGIPREPARRPSTQHPQKNNFRVPY